MDEQEASTPWANVAEEHLSATQPSTQAFADPSWKEGLRIETRRVVTQFEGTEPKRQAAIPRIDTSKKLAIMVAIMNADVLPPYIKLAVDLESWNMLVYCGAVAVVRMLSMDVEVEAASRRSRGPRSMPPWELRLAKKLFVVVPGL